MTNPNQEIQIEAIVERISLAVETRIQMREADRQRAADEEATESRRRTIGQIPAWIGVLSLIVGPMVGGGVLYAKITNTAEDARDLKARLDAVEGEDRNVAVQLATIKADVAFIKDRVK